MTLGIGEAYSSIVGSYTYTIVLSTECGAFLDIATIINDTATPTSMVKSRSLLIRLSNEVSLISKSRVVPATVIDYDVSKIYMYN